MTATTELVVPKSMPITLATFVDLPELADSERCA